ncbi:long-chain-fatty-acid--CoA ligase [Bacillus aquiflavi]|uniref:Long-chain-fatty-acid--CoA ligase n=1 Tax=Bacillus aquiflavi TaxID=2672567 RepID=A0A6B3VV94_9BACI|nr:long-chain-fatty-acid--CoA ligase [Bacillus aquiflavi]MBA4536811.1 long-chain-fatty-acid--CoA ligase [Bacillus aquiflavi]NEY81178.1 long-chain-fatty-acid--CoA ligase [Bacillus aquiflavi]UAC49738.1 long-chain-fatty-acid--CoA ligase [Bacillus aquiflavi]
MTNELTVFQVLDRSYHLFPNKEAVYDGKKRITYSELKEQVDQLATALKQHGIQKGDKIIVCVPGWMEFVVIYFSLAKLGAIMIPANTRYRSEELEYIVKNSKAKAAFVIEEFNHLHLLQPFISDENESLQQIFTVRFHKTGFNSFGQLLAIGKQQSAVEEIITPQDDVFAILYTSGTTGKPKGAMLTHRNFVSVAIMVAEWLRCNSEDVFLVPVPVFHIFGMVPSILSAVVAGSKLVLMESYKPENALHLIETERVTVHHGVPTMFILELNHQALKETNLSTLRTGIIAAAPCPEEVIKAIRKDMGCEVIVAYGATETSSAVTFTSFDDPDDLRAQTVGTVAPEVEIKIINEQGNTLGANEVGEIVCKGPGIMKGYYEMQEQTLEALDQEGWYRTGDLGTIDENGYIRIIGRKKEMIIRGGYNIYPREIEELLYKHPSVLEAAIVGLPDTVLGEVSCAALKLKQRCQENEESIKLYLQNRVANYKIPDHIVFLNEFPITSSGKIKKIELQTQLKNYLKTALR